MLQIQLYHEMNCTLQLYIFPMAKTLALAYCDQGPYTITCMSTGIVFWLNRWASTDRFLASCNCTHDSPMYSSANYIIILYIQNFMTCTKYYNCQNQFQDRLYFKMSMSWSFLPSSCSEPSTSCNESDSEDDWIADLKPIGQHWGIYKHNMNQYQLNNWCCMTSKHKCTHPLQLNNCREYLQ